MSTLKDDLALRRAAENATHPCYERDIDRASTLYVETSDAAKWLLQWSNFVHSCFQNEGARDRLVLTFQGCEVVLYGQNLDQLTKMVENRRLSNLRPISSQYLPSAGNHPFIEEAQVRPLAFASPSNHESNNGIRVRSPMQDVLGKCHAVGDSPKYQ